MNRENLTIDLSRMKHFTARLISLHSKTILMGAGAAMGAILLVSVIYSYTTSQSLIHLKGMYLSVFFFLGYILTSKIFNELNTPQQSYAYFLLPVSNLEKILGSWLITSPFYILAYSSFMVLILLAGGLASHDSKILAGFFNVSYLRSIAIFMVTQTFFFLGAWSFKRNAFIKTAFSLFLIQTFMLVLTVAISLLFFGRFTGIENINNISVGGNKTNIIDMRLFYGVFGYLLGFLMLVVSYFKLKGRHV
jgi:hypothetical protein